MSGRKMRFGTAIFLCLLALIWPPWATDAENRKPMPVDFERSATYRWLSKGVLESSLLDEMEDLSDWRLENTEQARAAIRLSDTPRFDGESSLRMECPTRGTEPLPRDRYFGYARLQRVVPRENWEKWNRVSAWVYPDMPGHKHISLLTILHNDGSEKVPDRYEKMGLNYVLLRNREWNHIVWEIANLPRDQVTAFEFQYRMQGNEPGASDEAVFYFDHLELERVDADHFEGWNVAPGRIAFSHIGYLVGLPKTAFASALEASRFRVVSERTGQAVFEGPVRQEETINGTFAVMDFTALETPGRYSIRAGDLRTEAFSIGKAVWDETIRALLNFFYAERCGTEIPGIHDVCHRDWVGRRDGQSIIINGGWHDAGDLSQGLKNTSQATYAMFALAEHLGKQDGQAELQKRLIDEAHWGLDWVIKTRFPDGSRISWATHDRWTDGIIGNADDMVAEAYPSASSSFMAAAAEAVAARVLAGADDDLAELSSNSAQQDWKDALEFSKTDRKWLERDVELASLGAVAALELFKTLGAREYADKAIELADLILSCQQREVAAGLDFPITGFFYSSPAREGILRYEHSSEQEAPVMVLSELCLLFPGHRDWMRWYSAVALYSRYYVQEMSRFSAPYHMLASALHRDDDHTRIPKDRIFPGANPEEYLQQVLHGVRVGPHHFVRRFPVWFVFRGNNGTLLSEALGLARAAQLRGSLDALSLAQEQLMWVIGRNPFGESTVFGVGYDYPPQYAAMFGDQLGATAVGIQTRHERDVPYWPAENCHNWKETWVHPAVRADRGFEVSSAPPPGGDHSETEPCREIQPQRHERREDFPYPRPDRALAIFAPWRFNSNSPNDAPGQAEPGSQESRGGAFDPAPKESITSSAAVQSAYSSARRRY